MIKSKLVTDWKNKTVGKWVLKKQETINWDIQNRFVLIFWEEQFFCFKQLKQNFTLFKIMFKLSLVIFMYWKFTLVQKRWIVSTLLISILLNMPYTYNKIYQCLFYLSHDFSAFLNASISMDWNWLKVVFVFIKINV